MHSFECSESDFTSSGKLCDASCGVCEQRFQDTFITAWLFGLILLIGVLFLMWYHFLVRRVLDASPPSVKNLVNVSIEGSREYGYPLVVNMNTVDDAVSLQRYCFAVRKELAVPITSAALKSTTSSLTYPLRRTQEFAGDALNGILDALPTILQQVLQV
jgi:hypothetical protein